MDQIVCSSFQVSDVRATEAPKTFSAEFFVNSLMQTKVETISTPKEKVAITPYYHPFFSMLNNAFRNHFGVSFRADDIWLLITQGVAACVNTEPEKHRNVFVQHQEKIKITITNDSLVKGSKSNDWMSHFGEFSKVIKEGIGEDLHSLLLPDFSTTDPISRAASEICLMDIVQSYYSYRTRTRCGIPRVTLEGTIEDWERLVEKTLQIASKFNGELDWWFKHVCYIVGEFFEASKGNINTNFWNDMYKYGSVSGGAKANGYLIRLLPYLKNDCRNPCLKHPIPNSDKPKSKTENEDKVKDEEEEEEEEDEGYELTVWHGVSPNWFPLGISSVPFVWDYLGKEFNYQFLSGFMGATSISSSVEGEEVYSLKPLIGWAIRPV